MKKNKKKKIKINKEASKKINLTNLIGFATKIHSCFAKFVNNFLKKIVSLLRVIINLDKVPYNHMKILLNINHL